MKASLTPWQQMLFDLRDEGYRSFHCGLMPTVAPETVIGVRVPLLRKMAKERLREEPETVASFLQCLPHRYYEENLLHALFISQEKEFEHVLTLTEAFLPYVDNWAVCDFFTPKVFAGHRTELLPHIRHWLASSHPYSKRFALKQLMSHYLDESFEREYLDWAASLKSDEYYVNMMVAWYVCEALIKQYDAAHDLLLSEKMDRWTHNKSIQKAVESRRISAETKAYLKTLRR